MGGQEAGETASRQVVETLADLFSSSAYRHWVAYSPERDDYFAAVLKVVLEQVNERIFAQATSQEHLRGMGTTATVALLVGPRLFIGHVGDSRAYLMRNGQMKRLTKDHSWVEEQVAAGVLAPQAAAAHPQKNVITRALGIQEIVRVDRSIYDVQPNDVLIMCTDGLTNLISDQEIQQAVQGPVDLQRACDFLVNLANQRGAPDNVTILTARLVPGKGNTNLNEGKVIRHHQATEEQNRVTIRIARGDIGRIAAPRRDRWTAGWMVIVAAAILSAIVSIIWFPEMMNTTLSAVFGFTLEGIPRQTAVGCLGILAGFLLGVTVAQGSSRLGGAS